MRKKILLTLFLLFGFKFLGQVSYVQITYNIAPYPNNQYPAKIKAYATLEYDAYLNPAHVKIPVAGTYNSTTGQVVWTMPAGCYVRFVCEETKLNKLIQIPTENAILNNLLPADPPPAPAWATFFKTIDVPEGTDVSATTYWDILKLKAGEGIKVEGNATNKEITITNTKPDVTITGGGIVEVSGNYPNFTISATEQQGLDNVLAIGNTTNKNIITTGQILTKELKLNKSYNVGDILRAMGDGTLYYDKETIEKIFDLGQYNSYNIKQLKIIKTGDYYCEFKIGAEPARTGIGYFRLTLGAEDNGDYGYSGALVFENVYNNMSALYLEGDTLHLDVNTATTTTKYLFGADNLVMDKNNEIYEFYHTGNDGILAKKNSVNEFEANQFATRFIETTKYKADYPRPYGYPQTEPNTLDNEFEGEDITNYHWYSANKNPGNEQEENPPSIVSQNLYKGYLYISNNGAYNNKYFVKEIVETQDIILIAKISYPSYGNMLGINIIDSNGNGYGLGIYHTGSDLFYYRYSFTQWGTPNMTSTNIRAMGNYIMIRKRGNNISLGFSQDCITWITLLNEGTWNMNNNVKYIGFAPFIASYIAYPKPSALAIDFLRVE